MRLPVRIGSDFEPPVILAAPGISLNAAARRASDQERECSNARGRRVSDVHGTFEMEGVLVSLECQNPETRQ